ncbi:TPA: DUF6311 domain-containing protein [Enterobacter kobei]|uniref:DUF6311 domain-containing protein n=1 Tax=Enterobacter kobei TaxID=208224 RepID=UPI00063B035F|nr:DUF6311 domain-containing protein [Enterobacter kobei]KLG11821.1 hypothetical protein YA50_23225 [Enterobacter kobei]MCS4604480.1 hypothetical protein [Enterobacter kobei]MDV1945825.1 DUF6311 domain-containing protein [Enterobacter kobei]HDC4611962.1 hypothetical protein [Enterobacter kobei]HDC4623306.1 hypothetical protein [Enterobacter kobei]
MKNNYYRIAAGLIGFLIFIACGGMNILNVTNIQWFGSGDAAQHWLGWNFFRNTPILQWPLGLNEPYGMEVSSSIVFTDSIPLLAIIFKFVSFALPDTFQYTGIWILLCCILQGVFSYDLINRNTHDKLYSLVASALFCLAPIMLFRMMGHFALSAHFLIIASFILYSMNNANKRWVLLIAISSAIHFYITGMILSVFVAYLATSIIKKEKTVARAASLFIVAMLALAGTMYALGYFVIADGADGSGFGLYHMDLSAFINPMYGWVSSLTHPLPYQKLDYEGFAYLGAGVAFILIFGIACFSIYRGVSKSSIPGFAMCLFVLLFAISNNISIGGHTVYSFNLPDILSKAANVFRSSGRFIWIFIYASLAFFIIYIHQYLNRRFCLAVISVSCAVQLYDIHGMLIKVRERYSESTDMSRGLDNTNINKLMSDKDKIQVVMPIDFYFDWSNIGYIASKNKASMNFGYMARFSMNAKIQQQKSIFFNLYKGIYDTSTLYLFKDKWTLIHATRNISQKYAIEKVGDYYALSVNGDKLENNNKIEKEVFYQSLYSHYK